MCDDVNINMKIYLSFFVFLIVTHTEDGEATPTNSSKPKVLSYFEQVTRSHHFVDKSSMLTKFFKLRNVLVTCPKGFGKSTNMDMAKRFFELTRNKTNGQKIEKKNTHNYKLFTNQSLDLDIAQEQNFVEKHLGEYPVIYCSFSNIHGISYEEVIKSMEHIIRKVVLSYQWLHEVLKTKYRDENNTRTSRHDSIVIIQRIYNKTATFADYIHAFKSLSSMLYDFYRNKVMVFIDNYDSPTMQALHQGHNAVPIDNFMTSILLTLITGKNKVSHTMTVGVSRLFGYNIDLNIIDTTFLNYFLSNKDLSPYFGFTDDEVHQLLTAEEIPLKKYDRIKDYFNGYYLRRDNVILPIYNPRGILRYLETGNFQSKNSTPVPIIRALMLNCLHDWQFFKLISSIIRNKVAEASVIPRHLSKYDLNILADIAKNNVHKCPHQRTYLASLIDNGYLTYVNQTENYYRIPNKIMEKQLQKDLQYFFYEAYNVNLTNSNLPNHFRSIVNSPQTTSDMLTSVGESLQSLCEQFDSSIREYQFKIILYGTLLGKMNMADVPLKNIFSNSRCFDEYIDTLRITSDDSKTLLVIRIAYKQTLQQALEEASDRVPLQSRNTSDFNTIKYLGINLKSEDAVEIAPGNNRYNW